MSILLIIVIIIIFAGLIWANNVYNSGFLKIANIIMFAIGIIGLLVLMGVIHGASNLRL
jgi:succinate dehydrogenase hydrophobic anchor subunit